MKNTMDGGSMYARVSLYSVYKFAINSPKGSCVRLKPTPLLMRACNASVDTQKILGKHEKPSRDG